MGWPRKKKDDPISERARDLQAEIAKLEAQIQDLSSQVDKPHPRLRSTARPAAQHQPQTASPPSAPAREQVFEAVDHKRLQAPPEAVSKTLYNELGVRKYDLPSAWQRLRSYFSKSEPPNQPLVKLLAAGNIQGLKPLRYEKRIARRRFITGLVILVVVFWGLLAWILKHY